MNIKKIVTNLLITFAVVAIVAVTSLAVKATDPVADLQNQINELVQLRELSQQATAPLQEELDNLNAQISSIRSQLAQADEQTEDLSNDIDQREIDLADQYSLLSARVRSYYKLSRAASPFLLLLVSESASDLSRQLSYRSAIADEDKTIIISTTKDLIGLESDKEELEKRKVTLASLRLQFESEASFFAGEIEGAEEYQAQLGQEIASLTAKQQAIVSARSGNFITSVGSVPIGSDFAGSIAGFNQDAPSGYMAVFSFGAYTHRNGMSQYGAKAQSDGGKSYQEIIQWYYGVGVKKDEGSPTTIDVQGEGTIEMQKYLYGIAEMPSSWSMNALKAQAIAARTYAIRSNKPICITQSCQVFLKSKSDNPPAEWKQAVDDTNKEVIDGDVSSQYSSTTGGYLNTSGWDTTDKSNSGDWTSRAWESIAGSPWFYKSWYRQSYANSSNDCGRKPWMSETEMADILNAWLVLKQGEGNGVETGRVVPVTINQCPIGGESGNPYSMDELKSKLGNPVTSISGKPVVSNNNSGSTTNVRFVTNRGELNVPGGQFKEVFNTRAPGYLSVPQSGFAFFNIERK